MTLLGERSDWEIILQRLEKIPQLGEEPTIFYGLLKPVIGRFVHSFTSPTAEDTRDFWQKIVHKSSGSGAVRFPLLGSASLFPFTISVTQHIMTVARTVDLATIV